MKISKETEWALFEVVKIILSIPMMILNIIVATLASLAVLCYLFRDIDFTLALFQHYFVAFYGFELKLVHIYLAITSLHLLSVICYRIYVYVDSYRKYSPYKETSSVMGKPKIEVTFLITLFGLISINSASLDKSLIIPFMILGLIFFNLRLLLMFIAHVNHVNGMRKNEIQI